MASAPIFRFAAWLAVCSIVVFWRLGYPSLLDPDEAHYAQLTREMLRSRSWFVPLLDGHPYIDKPVLFHWLQAVAVAALGETEFAIRIPSALAAIGTIAVTRWAAAALFGPEIGRWAAIMFATIPATFALASVALFDMVFTLFLFGSVACFTVAVCRPASRWYVQVAGFTLLALAVMTKGPIALLIVLLWVGLVRVSNGWTDNVLHRLSWIKGTLAVLVAASPWFVWMSMTFGRQFVDHYLLAGNLWYFTQPARFSNRSISHIYYFRVLIAAFFPWSVVLIGRAADVLRQPTDRRIAVAERLLWAWITVVVLFFTVARFKLDHYIFPAAPAVAIVAAHGWVNGARERFTSVATRLSIVAVGVFLVVAAAVFALIMYRLDLDLGWSAATLPFVLGASGIALLVKIASNADVNPPSPTVVVLGLLAAYVTVVVVGFPVLERTRPMAHVARRIASNTAPTDPVGIYRLERWRASLRYYVNRRVASLENPTEVAEFLARSGQPRVVMLRPEFELLRASGLAIRTVYERRGVVGTTGRILRRQRWDFVVVVARQPDATPDPESRATR